MPAKKSPAEALDASFKRLKLAIPAHFVADPTKGEHANLQRVFACGMDTPDTFDAEIGGLRLQGIIVRPDFVRNGTADGRTWREIARISDVEIAIGIFDEGAEDPQVYRASVDEGWDDSDNVPLPGKARPLCSLSQFVAKVKRRAAEKLSKAPPADLKVLAWDAPMALRTFTSVHVGGPAVLGRVREPKAAGVEEKSLNEGVGIFHADGRIETVAMHATHSNYLGSFAWAGDAIITLGQRRNMLTHVGILERSGATWTARELWGVDPSAADARKTIQPQLAATAEVFAYTTKAEAEGPDELVHAWRRRDGAWQAVRTLRVGASVRLFAIGPDRIGFFAHLMGRATLTELLIDDSGVRPGEAWAVPEPQAVDQGRIIVNTMYQGKISIFERGAEVQTIKTPKLHGLLTADHGRLVAVTTPESVLKPGTLLGYLHDGKAYVPWFELANANLVDHRGRCDKVQTLALTQNTVYLGFDYLGVRRVELPEPRVSPRRKDPPK